MAYDIPDKFIGRGQELEKLRLAWSRAREGKPQVCVLRGESGFGKTRIVQAFYSWLSSDPAQDPNGYWPDVLLKEGKNLRLNPPPECFGIGKALPWLWWGVRWDDPDIHNKGELSSCAIIDGLHHLEVHRQALSSRTEYVKRMGKAGLEAGAALANLASLGIVGTLKDLGGLAQLWREERGEKARDELSVAARQEMALQEQADTLFAFLRTLMQRSALNQNSLPVILVLDDAQWIDARSLALVSRLLAGATEKQWPLMLILTHWERDWHLQTEDQTRDSFPALCSRLSAASSVSAPSLAIDICDIGRLPEVERLLVDALPGLTPEQVAFLGERADGNPRLMVEIILDLRDEPSYFVDEDVGGHLSEDGLAALRSRSFELHEVQKRRFRRLDDPLRELLGYASHQGMRFLRDLALEVAGVVDKDSGAKDNALRLARAIQPYAVLAAESAVIYEFRHRVFHDLARERIDRLPQLARSLSQALVQVVSAWLNSGRVAALSAGEQETFYLLALDKGDFVGPAFRFLRLRLITGLCRHYWQSGYLVMALEWSAAFAREIPGDGRIPTEILGPDEQGELINLWQQLEQRELAERLARGFNETCSANISESGSSAEALSALSAAQCALGDVLLGADQPEAARALYEKSLGTRERIVSEFGETAERLRDVSGSQIKLGDVLLGADQPEAARALYEKSLGTRERFVAEFGETAQRLRDVSVSRFKLGLLAFEAGYTATACSNFAAAERLLVLVLAILGTQSAAEDVEFIRGEIGRLGCNEL